MNDLKKPLITLILLISLSCASIGKGVYVSAMGLPHCGKTSTFTELGKMIGGCTLFHEPGPEHWPEVVKYRDLSRTFDQITGMRLLRIPGIMLAGKKRDAGETVFTDCSLDQTMHYIITQPAMEQFYLQKSDPYYKAITELAKADMEELPVPDVMVFFDIDYETWLKFIDKKTGLKKENEKKYEFMYANKRTLKKAAQDYAAKKGTKLIVLKQETGSPRIQAERLLAKLKQLGLFEGR